MQLFVQPPIRNFQPTVIPDDVAVYRIKEGKFFADDELYESGSIIAWPEEPNLEMEPLNDLAFAAMREYLIKLDGFGREAAKAVGKGYVSYAEAFENQFAIAKEEGKRATLLNARKETPILGGRRKGQKSKAKKIELAAQPETVGTNGKLTIDGRMTVNAPADLRAGDVTEG